MPNYYDQSIYAFLYRLTQDALFAKYAGGLIIFSFVAIMADLFFHLQKKHKGSKILFVIFFSMFIALMSVSNFFSWQHHLVFAYPLILILYLINFNRHLQAIKQILYHGLFLLIWVGFVWHFKGENATLFKNPFVVSYQTFLVLGIIIWQIIIFWKQKGVPR